MNFDNIYIKKMYSEFCEENGLLDGDNFYYKDDFFKFLVNRSKSALVYASLFEGVIDPDILFWQKRNVAEFGMGTFDTSTRKLYSDGMSPIVVSRYANTINDLGILTTDGELEISNPYGAYINYKPFNFSYPNCNIHINDDLGYMMLPVYSEVDKLIRLLESDVQLFIGTHGQITDKSKEEKIKRLVMMEDVLDSYGLKKIDLNVETLDDVYVAGISVLNNVKARVLTKSR